MIRHLIPSVLVLAVLCSMATGCNKASEAMKEEKQEVKTFKVSTTDVQTYIEATGNIQADLEGTAKIVSPLPGTVNKIFVRIGERVNREHPLVSITSPDMTDAYSAYLSATSQAKQAERIYNLNKQLFDVGAITKNDLLISEANYNQSSAVVAGLKNKLSIYGISSDEESMKKHAGRNDQTVIKSPINGFVADVQAHVGDRVDATSTLMTVADPGNVVLVANIYDTDVPKIKKGSNVTFTVDAFPSISFKGVISYISDVSDPDSKTVKTFVRIADRKDLFKQNMFLRLKIEGEKKVLPVIPQSAMVYKDGKFFVYFPDRATGKRELRAIRPVREVPEKSMAVEGLNAGDEIVLSAIELERP